MSIGGILTDIKAINFTAMISLEHVHGGCDILNLAVSDNMFCPTSMCHSEDLELGMTLQS